MDLPMFQNPAAAVLASLARPDQFGAPPAMDLPAPMVMQNQVAPLIAAALAGNPGLRPQDQSDVRLKLGTSLMQPRMPGQSVAGNVGAALQGAVTDAQRLEKENEARVTQRGQMGMQLATQQQQLTESQQRLEMVKARFPAEWAKLTADIKTAQANGDLATLNAYRTALISDPEKVLRSYNAGVGAQEAQTKVHDQLTRKYKAEADLEGDEEYQKLKKDLLAAQAQYQRSAGKSTGAIERRLEMLTAAHLETDPDLIEEAKTNLASARSRALLRANKSLSGGFNTAEFKDQQTQQLAKQYDAQLRQAYNAALAAPKPFKGTYQDFVNSQVLNNPDPMSELGQLMTRDRALVGHILGLARENPAGAPTTPAQPGGQTGGAMTPETAPDGATGTDAEGKRWIKRNGKWEPMR